MASNVNGVVEKIWKNRTPSGKTAYAIVVEGQRYGGLWEEPSCKEGDTVSFSVEVKGDFKNVAKGSLKVAATAPSTPSSSGKFGGYADNRQETISRQAASNTALAFMSLLQSVGALDIKATAKPAEKLEAMEKLVQHYTVHFYEQNTGQHYKDITPAAEADMAQAGVAASATGGW